MNQLEVKIKKINDKAVIPTYSKEGDAGLDLTTISVDLERCVDGSAVFVYHTGLSIEIPEGYVGLLFPRSSIVTKSLSLTNAVGVIDSGYRGELMCKFKLNTISVPSLYSEGERFAQLVIIPYPKISLMEVEELSESERGNSGYGSTNIEQNEPNEQSV